MDISLINLLKEIEVFGRENDAVNTQKEKRMRNITKETGEFLHFIVRLTKAQHIIEIGTSNGYSTLWLADAAKENNGVVTTLEVSEIKANLASNNFNQSGLGKHINLLIQDAGHYLNNENSEAVDFIFLDSDRVQYVDWWGDLVRVLKMGGLLVVDNVLSHKDELLKFLELVNDTPDLDKLSLPIGSGLLLIHK